MFNLPREVVTNYFNWRQQDAIRNSIQMVGQAHFSQTELNGKCNQEIIEMLIQQKDIDWNKFTNSAVPVSSDLLIVLSY